MLDPVGCWPSLWSRGNHKHEIWFDKEEVKEDLSKDWFVFCKVVQIDLQTDDAKHARNVGTDPRIPYGGSSKPCFSTVTVFGFVGPFVASIRLSRYLLRVHLGTGLCSAKVMRACRKMVYKQPRRFPRPSTGTGPSCCSPVQEWGRLSWAKSVIIIDIIPHLQGRTFDDDHCCSPSSSKPRKRSKGPGINLSGFRI